MEKMENIESEKTKEQENGSIILETAIVLPIFILVALFLYGLFFVVSTQNQVTSAMFQATKSLSLDPYLNDRVNSVADASHFWGGLGEAILDFQRVLGTDKYYSDISKWYSGKGNAKNAVKNRFIGYFAGGKESEAKARAKKLGIVNGLDGIKLDAKVSNKKLTVDVEYVDQTWFDAFGFGKVPIHQQFTVALWGVKE